MEISQNFVPFSGYMNFILATNVFGLTKVSDTLDFKDVFCVYSVNHLRLQKCITFFDILNIVVAISIMIYGTPARTLFISGLKSRVLKLPFLTLKMMGKSGLEFILKLTEPLQRYLLSCQANSAILGRYFCTGQQQL